MTFSVQKFMWQILDLNIGLFSDVFRKNCNIFFRKWGGVKGRMEFFQKLIRHPSLRLNLNLMRVLAMATLCRSPPDSFTPRSPTIVSYCNKSGIDMIFLLKDIKVPHLTFVDLTQQTQDLHTLSQHTNHTGPPAVFLNVIVNIILNWMLLYSWKKRTKSKEIARIANAFQSQTSDWQKA